MSKNRLVSLLPSSFPGRLTLLLVLVFLIVSGSGTYLARSAMRAYTEKEADIELTALTDTVVHITQTHPRSFVLHSIHDLQLAWGTEHIAFRIIDENGNLFYAPNKSNWPIQWPATGTTSTQTIPIPDSRRAARIITRRVSSHDGHQYTIQAAHSLKDEFSFLAKLDHASLALIMSLIFALALVGWLAATFAMHSIAKITQAAEVMAGGVFVQNIPPSGVGADIDRLVSAFNKSSRRLSALIKELIETNDHLAHDLKTPITQIRAAAELLITNETEHARTEKIADIIDGCDALLSTINTTLDAAEINAGIRSLNKQNSSVQSIFSTIEEMYLPLAEDKEITFTILPSTALISADKQLLLRALANLVDNAIKFTPEQGHIQLAFSSSPVHDIISVKNSGHTIPSKEQQLIFSRLYRTDTSRSTAGSGLGLYIAKSIAKAHDGDITVTSPPRQSDLNNRFYSGAEFRILLPKC